MDRQNNVELYEIFLYETPETSVSDKFRGLKMEGQLRELYLQTLGRVKPKED